MPTVTKPVRSPRRRTFTLKQIEQASALDHGLCLSCGASQEGCEPDARNYRCENCGQDHVHGAEEIVLMGLMR